MIREDVLTVLDVTRLYEPIGIKVFEVAYCDDCARFRLTGTLDN
jgi:hypothetical protein